MANDKCRALLTSSMEQAIFISLPVTLVFDKHSLSKLGTRLNADAALVGHPGVFQMQVSDRQIDKRFKRFPSEGQPSKHAILSEVEVPSTPDSIIINACLIRVQNFQRLHVPANFDTAFGDSGTGPV